MLDVLIIGSGPAGLSAAIYAKRANLNVLVVEKEVYGAGQISYSNCVDNYLGFDGVSGFDLGEKFREHVKNFGVEFHKGEVVDIRKENKKWNVVFKNGEEYETLTVIFAGGCKNRSLGIQGEEKLIGSGISYCALCDGAFFKNKNVAVVGGGDTALDDAMYLSEMCSTVFLIHRSDKFRGSANTLKKLKLKENVIIKTNVTVNQLVGVNKLEGVILNNGEEIKIDGLFLAIGMIPQTDILKNLGILDKNGYIIADEDCCTSENGLFVAGDVRTKKLRQVVTAVSDGANSVYSVVDYLNIFS